MPINVAPQRNHSVDHSTSRALELVAALAKCGNDYPVPVSGFSARPQRRLLAFFAGPALALTALAGCGEWRPFVLTNLTTGVETACYVSWGTINDEHAQRLRQCIAACEAQGFTLVHPEEVPPPVPHVENAMIPAIPLECRPPSPKN